MKSGCFNPGTEGAFGPGIYFAYQALETVGKSQGRVEICFWAEVEFDRPAYFHEAKRDLSIRDLNTLGYGSVAAWFNRTGWEYCVYDRKCVKRIGVEFTTYKFSAWFSVRFQSRSTGTIARRGFYVSGLFFAFTNGDWAIQIENAYSIN
jgi:hypothetical protein